MSYDLTKFPMLLILASFKSHLWDFTQTFQIILLLNITKPGKISFHNGKFWKVVCVWKNIQEGIMQAVINLHSSISVCNCCNDKNKTKEILEGDTCRYEGGASQGSHSHFLWPGVYVARNICSLGCMGKCLTACEEQIDLCIVYGYLGIWETGVSGMRGFFHFNASCLNRQLLACWATYNTIG